MFVVAGLLLVASGYRPRWTAPLHWWLTFSVAAGISLPDGGEAVAQNVTFLLMFLCVNDRRRWHWSRAMDSRAGPRLLNGLSYVTHWAIRVQMCYVYLNSSLAKLAVKEWSNGTALFYILRGENFGTAAPWSGPLIWVSGTALGALGLAWGTIAIEGLIAVSLVGRPLRQRWSWRLCVMLHSGIALFLGLWSFGMIMVGAVTVATFRAWRPSTTTTSTSLLSSEADDRGHARRPTAAASAHPREGKVSKAASDESAG